MGYVSFGVKSVDTKNDPDNDDGIIVVPSVTLDGEFTFEEIEAIRNDFLRRIKDRDVHNYSRFPLVYPSLVE